MKRLLLILLLPLSVFAQSYSDASFLLFWDAAKTDTQFAVHGTDSLVSQAFRVKSDMSMQMYIQSGDTAAALDSTKIRTYFQYSLGYDNAPTEPGANMWSYQACELGQDSIGLDSTRYDASSGGGQAGQPIINISTECPAVWSRAIIKGLLTNCVDTGDSTKGVIRIQRYSN